MNVSGVSQLTDTSKQSAQTALKTGAGSNAFAAVLAQAFEPRGVSGVSSSSPYTAYLDAAQSGLLSRIAEDGGSIKSVIIMLCLMMLNNSEESPGAMGSVLSSLAAVFAAQGSKESASGGAFGAYSVFSGTVSLKPGAGLSPETGLYNNTYVYNTKAKMGIPSAPSVAANPYVTSNESNRSAALYRAVIDQFNVRTNPRYAPDGGTYCNIFVWDVTRAMGAEIPHYIDPVTQEPRYYPDVSGALEMNANRIYNWLLNKGPSYGWYEVSPEQAQALANDGHPVVTAWRNPSGHGHVQVVCPSKNGAYDPQRGVTIAQAGRRLFDYAYITQVYGKSLSQVKYFAHY